MGSKYSRSSSKVEISNEREGRGQKAGLPRAPKGAESLCILRTKSTLHYRFITSAVLQPTQSVCWVIQPGGHSIHGSKTRVFKSRHEKHWIIPIQRHIPAGKVYLSLVVDCFDGMLPYWTISTKPDAALVNDMPDGAISQLGEEDHPIIHSDRGCHYRWPGWISRMEKARLERSMSPKGAPVLSITNQPYIQFFSLPICTTDGSIVFFISYYPFSLKMASQSIAKLT